MTSSLFDGQMAVTGLVSTKTKTPTFHMDLGIKSFDIAQSFQGFELFQNMAPIAKAIQGKLNTEITLKGDLTDDFTPNLNSLSGNALAEILSSTAPLPQIVSFLIAPLKEGTVHLLSATASTGTTSIWPIKT